MGDKHVFFQNVQSVQLEETKKIELRCIRDEERRLLRVEGGIRERWVRLFHSLLNAKSDMLDSDIPKRLPLQPVLNTLWIEPKQKTIATVNKTIANAKAVRADGLAVKLLKLGLQALRLAESSALPQDQNGKGNRGPHVWMKYVDPSPGTLRANSIPCNPGTCFASSGHST